MDQRLHKPSHHLIILVTLLLFSFNLCLSLELCNPHDKKVLLQIKSHFIGNSITFYNWDTNYDCCTDWMGEITCDANGRVTGITIRGSENDTGTFPSAFGDLPFLQSLVILDFPKLSGPIHPAIAKLRYLQEFTVWPSNLSGPIPDFMGRLTNLTTLFLDSGSLTGRIPYSLGRLTKLQSLTLSNNKLSGPIPDFFAKMTSLESVVLNSNKLTGNIPASLGLLPLLRQLDLYENQLTGPIPASLGHLPILSYFNLSHNQLTGPIPKSLALKRAQPTWLDLSFNKLTGDASFLFAKNTNTTIKYVYLNNNLLKFNFTNVNLRRSLKGFNISHNMIYGSLPKHLGQLPLDFIDVSYNQLCGVIPTGRRLKRFSPVYFTHNKCLCGRPLPSCK